MRWFTITNVNGIIAYEIRYFFLFYMITIITSGAKFSIITLNKNYIDKVEGVIKYARKEQTRVVEERERLQLFAQQKIAESAAGMFQNTTEELKIHKNENKKDD